MFSCLHCFHVYSTQPPTQPFATNWTPFLLLCPFLSIRDIATANDSRTASHPTRSNPPSLRGSAPFVTAGAEGGSRFATVQRPDGGYVPARAAGIHHDKPQPPVRTQGPAPPSLPLVGKCEVTGRGDGCSCSSRTPERRPPEVEGGGRIRRRTRVPDARICGFSPA
ncbi:unnamed protein product [Urochloa humidicola]